MANHAWTESDDLMVLYIHKFGLQDSPLTKQQISAKIGVSVGSLSYRQGNFKAIDGIGKATHFAKISLKVSQEYGSLSMSELKSLAFKM